MQIYQTRQNVETMMHYGFESLFLNRKKEKVSSVFVLETVFLFKILTLDYDCREGFLRPFKKVGISDCNRTRTHHHLVRKETLNHLAKLASLAEWLSVRLQTKW